MRQKLLNLKNLKIKKNIEFFVPDLFEFFNKSKRLKVFSHLNIEHFVERAKKGKQIKLKDINLNHIKNLYTNINQCVPWKLIKLQQEQINFNKFKTPLLVKLKDINLNHIKNLYTNIDQCVPWKLLKLQQEQININKFKTPLLVKLKNDYFEVVDGNTLLGLFLHLKRADDVHVYLIDESEDSKDFYEKKQELTKNIILRPYDYGNITENDKSLIRDIITLLDNKKTTQTNDVKNVLEQTFGLTEKEKYNLEESPFYNLCKNNGIKVTIQGYLLTSENNIFKEYPIVSFMDDIRIYDNLLKIIIEKYVIRK